VPVARSSASRFLLLHATVLSQLINMHVAHSACITLPAVACHRDLPPEVAEGCAAVQELLQDVGRQLAPLGQQVQRWLRVVSQVGVEGG
jgi:hypothetical protein